MVPEIQALADQIQTLRDQRRALLQAHFAGPVQDHALASPEGVATKLSDYFGPHEELIVIHNMGRGCDYCTLWADGFNGLARYFPTLTGLVLVSPDAPEVVREFAQSRGWKFPVASDPNSELSKALGFYFDDGVWPGFSIIKRSPEGELVRTGGDFFGPGDDYCSVFPMMAFRSKSLEDWDPGKA